MVEIPEPFTRWGFWWAVGGAVVALAAVLLITVLVIARGIAAHAERALAAARRIEANTKPIWALAGALETLVRIREAAVAIAQKTGTLAGTLHGEPGGARRRT